MRCVAVERIYPKITIGEKAEKTVRKGHPWVYSDEILSISSDYKNGDLVDVFTSKNKWMGTGFINNNSKIMVRIFSRDINQIYDDSFWERRVRYAISYRQNIMGDDFSCCRLIFGEADFFPGLTVDLFGDVLVTEVLCLGIDLRKDIIYNKIIDVLSEMNHPVRTLYERNDSTIRKLEGMDQYCGYYCCDKLKNDTNGKIEIQENGIRYSVDYIVGQKTGFFLDQKYNRLAVAKIAAGKNVLDCFTHTGAFALNAAKAGAKHVTAVDISKEALCSANENSKLNCLQDRIDFVESDVFEYLDSLIASHEKSYDLIILDPPAFTKSNKTVQNAYNGYKSINYKAMKALPRGGYLATCSCSHFMKENLFCQMLLEAANDAGVQLRQIEARQQAMDHPILWNVPETYYLKFYIFQIV